MIYKLDQQHMIVVDEYGMRTICIAGNGLHFLVQGDQLPEGVEYVEQYTDDQESFLLTQEEWIQPTEDV